MAADLLGSMRVEIVGDNSQLDRTINDSRTNADKFGKTLKKLFAGIGFAVAIKAIAKVGTTLINAASDAEETKNKFNVVFASVADAAKDASERIQDEFRLSESTTENFLSGVGDITSGLGATSEEALLAAEKITSLGLDIDSFANLTGGASQAVSALTSLFTGEREAAKALGIVINDNNLKQFAEDSGLVFKELSPLEKGFLSLELAVEQSQLAIGDALKSQGSFANQAKATKEAIKDLSVELGKNLLPAATDAISIFGTLTEKLTEFVKAHNELQEVVGRFEADTETAEDVVFIAQRELNIVREKLQLKKEELANLEVMNERDEARQQALQAQVDSLTNQVREASVIVSLASQEAKERQKVVDAEIAGNKADADAAMLEAERLKRLTVLIQARKTANIQLAENVEAIETAAKAEVITAEEKNAAIIDAETEFQEELLRLGFDGVENSRGLLDIGDQNLIDSVERRKILLEGFEEERLTTEQIAADERLSALLMEEQAIIDRDTRIAEFRIEKDKETNDKIVEQREAAISSITSILSTFDSIGDAFADAELQRLEDSGASQEELDKKKAQFAKENAIRERAAALFQIAVDTPAAIVKALTAGPILGPILAGVIGGLAAVQAISLIAAPLPKFAQGGIVAGNSFVGDNIPTLQNSGEMDITRSQQAALWDFIQGGSRGNTTNNNNSSNININSMFTLGNEAQIRQMVKTIFPEIISEGKRRGVTIGA